LLTSSMASGTRLHPIDVAQTTVAFL
jgi:hypothetical protein